MNLATLSEARSLQTAERRPRGALVGLVSLLALAACMGRDSARRVGATGVQAPTGSAGTSPAEMATGGGASPIGNGEAGASTGAGEQEGAGLSLADHSGPSAGVGAAAPNSDDASGGEPSDAVTPVVSPSNCVPNGAARNPLVSHIFTADPNAVVYGDRVYVYVSHDLDGQDNFDMVDYHAFSSADMVNWQDHGVIIHADSLSWADNLYAPGACEKNGKYYLYIPNGGSSIGVAVADDPGGPFVDPIGRPLVTKQASLNTDVTWLFDPACLVDEDGQAYLYFGGGNDGATRDNARVIRLGDDMISLADARATTIPIPRFFEAMHVHEHDGTYFLQYSADFSMGASLEYLTSRDPMTAFQYQGVLVSNGSINNGNNNHGSLVDFRGKAYQFYHNRKLMQELGTNKVNNRSVAVQEVAYGPDGTLNQIAMSTQNTTVAQLDCLDAFVEVQAEALAAEKGVEVEGNAGETVRVAAIDDGDWVGYSQVDFRDGATALVAQVASASGGGAIDVRIDGCDDFTADAGASIGTCQVASTGGPATFAGLSCALTKTSGAHDLCLRFSGGGSFELDSWHLE